MKLTYTRLSSHRWRSIIGGGRPNHGKARSVKARRSIFFYYIIPQFSAEKWVGQAPSPLVLRLSFWCSLIEHNQNLIEVACTPSSWCSLINTEAGVQCLLPTPFTSSREFCKLVKFTQNSGNFSEDIFNFEECVSSLPHYPSRQILNLFQTAVRLVRDLATTVERFIKD